MESREVSYNNKNLLMESREVSHNGRDLPVESREVSHNGKGLPMESREVSHNGKDLPMESREVSHNGVWICPPDGEGVVDVPDVDDHVVVSDQHCLRAHLGDRVELVVE